MKAIQFLRLCCGGYVEPWIPALTAIRNLRQLVHNTLTPVGARRIEEVPDDGEDISLVRCVFSKVPKVGFA